MTYEFLKTERRARVAWLTIDRPAALNALNAQLVAELSDALVNYGRDDDIGCVVLTGSSKVFCAGADIKEALSASWPQSYLDNFLATYDGVSSFRKPMIAAVSGYALGGVCEIAMMCDLIIASTTAKFALPEVRIGTIPGAGGTQRLARSIGKAKAMDLCLTGRQMDAQEAERCGLVSRVVDDDQLMDEVEQAAIAIAGSSLIGVMAIKESIGNAFDCNLSQGLRLERRLFQAICGSDDQREGMTAFVEKRTPQFHRT